MLRTLFSAPGGALAALLTLILATAVPGLAAADDAAPDAEPAAAADDDDDDPEVRLEKSDVLFVEESLPFLPKSSTIATKIPAERAWTPAHVGVVDLGALEEQEARVLGDALLNVSGLNVQTGNGVFDYFVMRGFDSLSSGLILTDGAPEPEVTFYQLYNTERVEVFKGPAGFLYGSNPLAGVVNLVRKQPVPAAFGKLGFTAGAWDTYEASVDWNSGSSDRAVDFRVNGMWRESDGYRDGRESEVRGINPALTYRPSERTTLHLNLEALSSDFVPDAGLPLLGGELAPVPRSRSYASPGDFSTQDLVRFQLDVESRLSDTLVLRNKTYWRGLDWRTEGTLINGAGPDFFTGQPGTRVFRSLLLLEDRQGFAGNQLEAMFQRDGSRHRWLAGLEVGRYADEFTLDVGLLPSLDLFDPVEPAGLPPILLPDQSARGDSTSTILAPYLVDEITLTERLRLFAGARFDAIDFDDDASGSSRSDSEVSPILGAVFSPRPGWSLYANVARSFAPPSPRVVGERRPEESRQVEVGLRRGSADGNLSASLALYRLERDNIAIPDENGFTQQAGDQRSSGLELELGARLGRSLDAWLAYAYTDSELTRFRELVFVPFPVPGFVTVDHSGNRSVFAPEHLLNVWVSRRFGERWTAAGGVRVVGSQFIAEDNVTELDSYALVESSLAYALDNWRLRLRLRNMTDEDYETRGFGSSSVIPGEPFSASLSFEYRL